MPKTILILLSLLITQTGLALDYATTVANQGPHAHYRLSDSSNQQGGANLQANSTTLDDTSSPQLLPSTGFDGFASSNTWARCNRDNSHYLSDLANGWSSDAGTISYWLQLDASGTGTQTGIFANKTGGATTFSGPDMIATYARINGSVGFNIDSTQLDAAAGTLSIGNWNHVLFTWERIAGSNNDEMHTYIDGVLVTSRSDANLGQFTIDYAQFGKDITGNTRRFQGRVDELAIWTRRLNLTEIEAQYQSAFTPAFIDSDFDLLDDNWELTYFTNLTVATGSGNNDADTLDNLAEQSRGTNPTLSDTDGDSLNDDIEDNDGIFDGAGDPGTSPILADTDDDGIDDGDEVSAANGYITNPNTSDTDGDGATDNAEILGGTDPTNALDFPIALPLIINEIMAANANGLKDGFGNEEDWIEIYNPNTNALNLQAFALSDDPTQPFKWIFPDLMIPADDYIVVFASGKDTNDVDQSWHTNFKLSSNEDGEYLGLTRLSNNTVQDQFSPTYPAQYTDISYGPRPSDQQLSYFDIPTPGAENGSGFPGVVGDTRFSVDRGFYTNAMIVAITSITTNATIRYTLDGTWPNETTGMVYTNAITVSNSTTLRAMAYFSDWLSTDVDTHTYLFIDQVVQQPEQPVGWPTDWEFDSGVGQDVTADYEMDPRVANNALPGYSVEEALLDLPTLSISMDPNDFLGPTGIYSHPIERWERTASIELLHPDGTPGFQEDCEIEMHGNSSRTPNRMQKHSFRLTFKKELGAAKLDYPIIPDSNADSFNKVVLRACFTDSWALNTWSQGRYRPNDSQYIRDVWMKESMKDMGHSGSSSTFMHLYVNGLYWGVYNPAERLDEVFCADNFGGEEEDWDVIADLRTVSAGNGNAWNAMYALANAGLSSTSAYEAIQAYVDLENFTDYMMLHFFANVEDWRDHNGYAIRNRAANEPFRWLVWDQEIALDNYGIQYYDSSIANRPGRVFNRLRENTAYRLFFADRVYHNLYNDGALSLTNNQARYLSIANQIDKAIVAESARWGDTQATTPYGHTPPQPNDPNDPDDLQYPAPPHNPIYFTREDSWLVERDNVITNHLPKSYPSFIAELRAENLYPSIDPPVFNQHGGSISNAFPITLTANLGVIYYTLDGSEPSTSASAMTYTNPLVLNTSPTRVQARALNGGEWSALASADFQVGVRPPAKGDLAISEIHYNPIGSDDTEFIELLNTASDTIDLTDLFITNAVDFSFGFSQLGAGERLIIVEDTTAFSNLYQHAQSPYYFPGIQVAGAWSGKLSNNSDTISLRLASNLIAEVSYTAGGLSNGAGLSRESCHFHGSPGRDNNCPEIRINEVVTNAWIEIASAGNDLSGLYLSRDRTIPLMTQIPATALTPFSVFTNPVFFTEALLSESDGSNNVLRIFDHQTFGMGTNFGRHTRSDTLVDFVIQQAPSPGAGNGLPRVGPVVISQFLPEPQTNQYEYIELANLTTNDVNLSNWRLSGAIDFAFLPGTMIPGCGRLLISETNSAAFGETVLGPWQGRLDNAGETINLRQSDDTLIDHISYFDSDAWPTSHAFSALHRIEFRAYGNDPLNWYTAGDAIAYPGSGPDPCADRTNPLVGTLQGNQSLDWPAIPGSQYRIEYREHLSTGAWQLLQLITATQTTESVALPFSVARRYYRVVWLKQ